MATFSTGTLFSPPSAILFLGFVFALASCIAWGKTPSSRILAILYGIATVLLLVSWFFVVFG